MFGVVYPEWYDRVSNDILFMYMAAMSTHAKCIGEHEIDGVELCADEEVRDHD